MSLCQELASADDITKVYNFLKAGYEKLVEYNLPYERAGRVANPLTAACEAVE